MVRLQLDEEAIFKVAVEITRPETRADYLDQVCAGNAALLHRVGAASFAARPPGKGGGSQVTAP